MCGCPHSPSVANEERRVPGYVFVLALILTGVLVAIAVVVLRPTMPLGPPVLLIRATDTIRASPDSTAVPADFGPKCSKWSWNDRRGVLAVESDVNLAAVEGVVFQQFVLASQGFAYNASEFVRPVLKLSGSGWILTSPVDQRSLAPLVQSGENVTINGQTYGPGATWTMQFSYDVITARGTVRILEEITFRNEGILRPHLVPTQMCV